MFAVECPKCKNEIPLGMTDCPVCAAKEAATSTAEAPVVSAPAASPVRERAAAEISPGPVVRRSTPAWLVMIGVAAVLGGILAGGYLVLLPKVRGGAAESAKQAAPPPFETPKTPEAAPALAAHKYAKYIEVAGIRIVEENKKPVLKLLLVNHAGAELTDIEGTVELRPASGGTAAQPIGAIEVKLPSLGPYESKELSAPLKTTLRAYELPDWQFLRATLAE